MKDEDLETNTQYLKQEQIYHDRIDELESDILNFKSLLQGPELSKASKDRETLTKKVAELEITILKEKKEGMIQLNEDERTKIYAIKKLSEEMDFKVKETQANLMALNDEQLQTTTRLTILQNHQLTTELDY